MFVKIPRIEVNNQDENQIQPNEADQNENMGNENIDLQCEMGESSGFVEDISISKNSNKENICVKSGNNSSATKPFYLKGRRPSNKKNLIPLNKSANQTDSRRFTFR